MKKWLQDEFSEETILNLFENDREDINYFVSETMQRNTFKNEKNEKINRYRLFLRKNNFKSSVFGLIEEEFNIVEQSEIINFDMYLTNTKISKKTI